VTPVSGPLGASDGVGRKLGPDELRGLPDQQDTGNLEECSSTLPGQLWVKQNETLEPPPDLAGGSVLI
jgi:hypothetical protein